MSRDTLRRFGQSFFWFAKWVVAPVVLGALVIAGAVLLSRREIDFDTFLNYFALGLLIFVVITLFYGIIAIHDVPYEIAKKRDHPHQDAIHAAGWVSLFTLHALWPFLWIWAMLYRPERGWGFRHGVRDRRHPIREARRSSPEGARARGEFQADEISGERGAVRDGRQNADLQASADHLVSRARVGSADGTLADPDLHRDLRKTWEHKYRAAGRSPHGY